MKKRIIIISSITLTIIIGIISVYIGVTYAATTTLANAVIGNSQGTGWSIDAEGLYKDGNGNYRYVGANPDNWVIFNNDYYRIIGVFNNTAVKLIRSRPLGSYAWGVYNTSNTSGTYSTYRSDWKYSSTSYSNSYLLLNEYFYNKKNTSTTYGNCSTWTYFNSNNSSKTGSCDNIVKYGISDEYRNYIQSSTWYLRGFMITSSPPTYQEIYNCEGGSNSKCTAGAYSTLAAPIGMVYISDYVYASGNYASSSSGSVTANYNAKNWLYIGDEWTMAPMTSSSGYNIKIGSGGITSAYSSASNLIRPTFYLKSTVKVTGGDGSYNNPYTISM